MWISNFCQNKSEQQHQFLAKGVHKMLENVSKACRIAIGDQWGDQQSTSWHHGQLLVTNNIQIYKSDVLGLNIITITTSPHSAAYLYTPPAQCSAVGHRSCLVTKVASRSVKNVFTKAAQFVCRLFMQIVMSGGVSFQDTFQWLGQFNNDEREHKKTNTTNSLLSFSNASQIEPGAARGSAVRIRNSSHLSQLSNCQGGQIKLRDQIGEITCSHSDPDNHHQS